MTNSLVFSSNECKKFYTIDRRKSSNSDYEKADGETGFCSTRKSSNDEFPTQRYSRKSSSNDFNNPTALTAMNGHNDYDFVPGKDIDRRRHSAPGGNSEHDQDGHQVSESFFLSSSMTFAGNNSISIYSVIPNACTTISFKYLPHSYTRVSWL
jgi:hypothetical protein